MIAVMITEQRLDKTFYHPGEEASLVVWIESDVDSPEPAHLQVAIVHLMEVISTQVHEITLQGGRQAVKLSFTPPAVAPRGYGLDLDLTGPAGEPLASASGAFDVLESWVQHPRYGFLSEFQPGRRDASETIDILAGYHINGLQFYDWMYRHEQFLTDEEPYVDLLGRRLSRKTVDALIHAAHQRGIAAMAYTAVYGASLAFYEQHREWALLRANGQPALFGDDFMAIMDPRSGSPWIAHLLNQFDEVLEQTAFDGIHLDQYGDPKEGYDLKGKRYELAEPLADLIDATRERVQTHRDGGAVVFNAVTNWPIETVAPAGQDFVYIEVWPPYNWFADLHDLIVEGSRLSGGKPVVLAAYISPQHAHNVILVDAVIFASGGGHIELGERGGMLADPYFPNYEAMEPPLAEKVRRMYDFAVRYQDLIGPKIPDVTAEYRDQVIVEGASTAANAVKNKVWPIVRQEEGFLVVNLVNLLGIERPEWQEPIPEAATALGPTTVRINKMARPVGRVWMATPDNPDIRPQELEFAQLGESVSLQIPALEYWSMIVIEWSK